MEQQRVHPKELALGIFAFGVTAITFWMWHRTLPLLTEGEYRDFIRFLIPVAGLAVSGSLFVLIGIFVRTRTLAYASAILLVVFPFFFLKVTATVLGASGIAVLLSLYAVYRMRQEFDYSLGFSVAKVVRAGLPVYFSVVALIVAMFYLSGLNEERALSAFVPRSLIQFFLDKMSGENGLFSDLPPVDSETTVDELIKKMAERELAEQGIDISTIPKSELSNMIELQRENLSAQFNIELKGDEKIGEAFYAAVTDRIENFFGPYQNLLPVAAAIIFFLAFKAFTWPLYFLAMFMSYLFIKVLVLMGAVRKEKVAIEVEKLVF